MKENLLLLHGALGSLQQFTDLAEKLSANFMVYSLNFDGHGGLASEQDFSIEAFSNNVKDFLAEHELGEISIFGYSMGGYVALHTALVLPHKIKKIITLGTKFDWDAVSTEQEVRMLNPSKIAEKVPHFAQRLQALHAPNDWKDVVEKTARMMLNMSTGAKLTDDDFKNITHPLIIGRGSQDQMVSIQESKRVTDLIPNARYVEIEGVEHPIEKIDVDRLVKYINFNLTNLV